MYDLIMSTINSGNYGFLELKEKIARLYAMGSITESQLEELLDLAVEKANPDTERPEVLSLIQNLYRKVTELTACVEELSARLKNLETGGIPDYEEEDTCEYPAWELWDGLSNQYQSGAIVSHKGALWQSTFNGQNVWEPGVVDDRFWVRYQPTE